MNKALKSTVLGLSIAFLALPTCDAKEDFIMDTSDIGRSVNGVVTSDQFLELGMRSASALRLEGENALRIGHVNHAIKVLQRSVEQAPSDMDGRIIYAQALEKKLISQKERDPRLFNFCVKQWLFVAKKAYFPDQKLQGRSHLVNLTGVAPKMWETSKRYLARVLLPEDGSTRVALGKTGGEDKRADKDL